MTDNKKIKAVIVDLDRTLLRTDKTLSEYSACVLGECQERGILVMAASARPIRDVITFQDSIKFDAITATNGAVVLLPDGLTEVGLSRQSGEIILSRLLTYPNMLLSVETDKGLFSNREISLWEPVVYHMFPRLPEDIVLYKILASSTDEKLYGDIQSVLTDDAYYTVAGSSLIQILNREATKWSGILKMLSYFDVDTKQAVFFGDDYDDVESIQKCGLGIGVANAIPEVLAAADFVADDNDADGVARFIEKHILFT